MSKVTIQDIAERCGVATSTVSRVLNGSNLISGNRADEIRKIAKELGYQKRVIRRSASRTILNVMVVLPFHSERSVQLFYDYSELLNGIQCFVPTEKANILTTSRQTDLIQNQYKKGGGIDAVIFAFTQPRSDVTIALKQKGIPILVINREWKQGDFVTCDHKKGVETITHNAYEKIVNSNPCYLSLNSSPNVAALRMEGFIHALEKRGFIDPQERILTVEKVEEIDENLADRIRQSQYNTVICFNDVIAISLLQQCNKIGIKVPQELAIAGFDNAAIRDIVYPPIDTMSLDVTLLGENAGRWLQEKVLDQNIKDWKIFVQPEYIPGETLKNSYD